MSKPDGSQDARQEHFRRINSSTRPAYRIIILLRLPFQVRRLGNRLSRALLRFAHFFVCFSEMTSMTDWSGALVLDTSREGITPASPAYSGISSPGSASPTSPKYRYSPDVHMAGQYSPGADSPGADSPGSLNGASSTPVGKGYSPQGKREEEMSAVQDVCGASCFSCLFRERRKKKKKDSRRASQKTSQDSLPASPSSPYQPSPLPPQAQAQVRLRLGIVIAHYSDPHDASKRLHVVHGMSDEGAARRSRLVQEGNRNHSPRIANLAVAKMVPHGCFATTCTYPIVYRL